MDTKLLLIRIVTLLFLESQSTSAASSSRTIAKLALEHINLPTGTGTADFSKDSQSRIKDIVIWMLEHPEDHTFDKADLLQRLRMATETDDFLFDAASTYISPEQTNDEILKVIQTNRGEINQFINKAIVTNIVKDAYHKAAFRPDEVDWSMYVKELTNNLEPYRAITSHKKDDTLVAAINLTDPESMAKAYKEGLKQISNEGVIRFGWQGFNRMFGQQGGGRRGEFIVVGALQSNFKSGTSLEMIKAAALYNKPYMLDPKKKPLIVRYSLENPAIADIIHIYKTMIEEETKQRIDDNAIDPIIAGRYVAEKLRSNGYEVIFENHNPSDFTYDKLFDKLDALQAEGYEIHLLNIDYLAMMSKKGCNGGATGQDIRDLFRRVRNYTAQHKILFVTPHQLSVDAKKKTREGVIEADFVREIANKGYWDSCSTIDQEVDMEINQHLVRVGGVTFVTWMRGKHRKAGSPTPFEGDYGVYRFGAYGYIPDDIFGVDQSRKSVASKPGGGIDGQADFDLWNEAA